MEIREAAISGCEKVYALWMPCAGLGLDGLDDFREGIARFLERHPLCGCGSGERWCDFGREWRQKGAGYEKSLTDTVI